MVFATICNLSTIENAASRKNDNKELNLVCVFMVLPEPKNLCFLIFALHFVCPTTKNKKEPKCPTSTLDSDRAHISKYVYM